MDYSEILVMTATFDEGQRIACALESRKTLHEHAVSGEPKSSTMSIAIPVYNKADGR